MDSSTNCSFAGDTNPTRLQNMSPLQAACFAPCCPPQGGGESTSALLRGLVELCCTSLVLLGCSSHLPPLTPQRQKNNARNTMEAFWPAAGGREDPGRWRNHRASLSSSLIPPRAPGDTAGRERHREVNAQSLPPTRKMAMRQWIPGTRAQSSGK
jgi:hypothetical protein